MNKANPDVLQLQDYEPPGFISEIKNKFRGKIIKVIHIESDKFDAGGTGIVHNWELSREINRNIIVQVITF